MSTYVRLRVASEVYAVPVTYVREVSDIGEVREVPGSGPAILGVRNMRGRILPVLDLAMLLGIPRTVPPSYLLVAEAEGVQAGFAIDEVSEVGDMPDPAEEAGSGSLLGATLAGGELIGVIDVPAVFGALEEVHQ